MRVAVYFDTPAGPSPQVQAFHDLLQQVTPDTILRHHSMAQPVDCDVIFHWETVNPVHLSWSNCNVLVLTDPAQFSNNWTEHVANMHVWGAALPPMLAKRGKRLAWLRAGAGADADALLAAYRELLAKVKPGYARPAGDPKEWPRVSILTPTRNRANWLVLAKVCFMGLDYPRERLEWVILDDGTTPSYGMIADIVGKDAGRVRYFYSNEALPIGPKRNKLVELASHDIIMHMDDDDFYGAQTVKTLVRQLLALGKECVFSCSIPMYDPTLNKSAFNVPPLTASQSLRVSEATMCYRRSFWKERKFSEVAITEGQDFLKGRIHKTCEVSPMGFFVSLLHAKNSSARREAVRDTQENGCVYNINPKIVELIKVIADVTQREKDAGVDYMPLPRLEL